MFIYCHDITKYTKGSNFFIACVCLFIFKQKNKADNFFFLFLFTGIESEFLLCRQCGGDLADAADLINIHSPKALILANQTVFDKKGTDVQVLSNPLGKSFQLVTISKASCVAYPDRVYSSFIF